MYHIQSNNIPQYPSNPTWSTKPNSNSTNSGGGHFRHLLLTFAFPFPSALSLCSSPTVVAAAAALRPFDRGFPKINGRCSLTCKINLLRFEYRFLLTDTKEKKFFKMKEEEVNRCQIQEWYPKFKSVSIKTQIHELPETFVEYLLDSGRLILPQSVYGEDALPCRIHNPVDEEDFQVHEDSEDESEQPSSQPCFPELELVVKESIENLGGAVFPKLNWSAPKDSAWISTSETLKCTSFSEVALLLRSSESLIHDLCHAFDSCIDKTLSRPPTFFLALRKWYPSFHPEMEFRCFVRSQRLVGISQREVTGFYPVLFEKKDGLESLLKAFFRQNVQLKFESEDYTFDVYVTGDDRVKLMDFNPWGAFTLPLMFTWEELQEKFECNHFEFRIIESQCAVRPGLKTAVPYDLLDTSPGSGWDEVLRKLDEELRIQAVS